jgi:hypothetical protein
MTIGGTDLVSEKSFSLPAYYATTELTGQDTDNAYMDPKGLISYLHEKGLATDSGLSFAEFTMTPGNLFGSATTLFDEIRQQKNVRISVSKLQHGEDTLADQYIKLLSRMVCLDVGPGIRTSEIGEAIRSTVIAAI